LESRPKTKLGCASRGRRESPERGGGGTPRKTKCQRAEAGPGGLSCALTREGAPRFPAPVITGLPYFGGLEGVLNPESGVRPIGAGGGTPRLSLGVLSMGFDRERRSFLNGGRRTGVFNSSEGPTAAPRRGAGGPGGRFSKAVFLAPGSQEKAHGQGGRAGAVGDTRGGAGGEWGTGRPRGGRGSASLRRPLWWAGAGGRVRCLFSFRSVFRSRRASKCTQRTFAACRAENSARTRLVFSRQRGNKKSAAENHISSFHASQCG